MVDLAELYELALLFGLWTAAALLFLLATKWRKTPSTEEGELPVGARLGGGESQREPEEPFDPADRRAVRRTALEHVGDRSELADEGQRVARRRTLQLIARIQSRPDDVTLRRQLIQAYLDGQDKAAAIQQLLVLADLLEEQGDVAEAQDCLRQVLELDPADEYAQRRLGAGSRDCGQQRRRLTSATSRRVLPGEGARSGTSPATFLSGSTPSESSAWSRSSASWAAHLPHLPRRAGCTLPTTSRGTSMGSPDSGWRSEHRCTNPPERCHDRGSLSSCTGGTRRAAATAG